MYVLQLYSLWLYLLWLYSLWLYLLWLYSLCACGPQHGGHVRTVALLTMAILTWQYLLWLYSLWLYLLWLHLLRPYGCTHYEPAGHSTVGMSKGRRNPSCSIRSNWPVGRRTCTEGRPGRCGTVYAATRVAAYLTACRYAASRVAARTLASYTRRHMSFVAAFKWRRGLPARRPPAGQAGGGRRGSCSPWHSRRCHA